MDDPASPIRYQVSYSRRVREDLVTLVTRAGAVGMAAQVLAAVREIARRLQIYPQSGQPLRDLSVESTRLWIGVVPPLVVHYVLDDENRQAMVVLPFRPLPHSGL